MLHGNGRQPMYFYPGGAAETHHAQNLNRQFESVYSPAHRAAMAPSVTPMPPVAPMAPSTPAAFAPTVAPVTPPSLLQTMPMPTPPPSRVVEVIESEEPTTPPFLSISLSAKQCAVAAFALLVAALLIAIVVLAAQTHSKVSALARDIQDLARGNSIGIRHNG